MTAGSGRRAGGGADTKISTTMPRPGRYFRWAEFEEASSRKLTARDRRAIATLCRLYLDPMRERFGRCTVHSASRALWHNRRVGGAERSYHLYNLRPGHAAADVHFDQGSPSEWADAARELGAGWVGEYPGHVHVDTRSVRAS